MEFENLEILVLNWANERNLLHKENHTRQMLKCVSEVGELSDALIKKDIDGIKDGVGDTIVTLIILCKQLDLNLTECLESAFNEIKNRKGKTVNGTFIKEV